MGQLLTKKLDTCPLTFIICRILYPNPSTFYEHFITIIVDIYPSISWLLIIAPSVAKLSIYVDSCLSSSEKKPQSG